MEHLLTPKDYFDPAIYEFEKREVFNHAWQFACFKQDLGNDGDYRALELAGLPVVIQRDGGSLRAFSNICSHRFARIVPNGSGRGSLVCPYHGVRYDRSGAAKVPKSLGLELSPDCSKRMRLTEHRVESCGNAVFVSVQGSQAPSLSSYLGSMGEHLELCTGELGPRVDERSEVFEANWKVVVENFLEFAHIPSIHARTFLPLGLDGRAGCEEGFWGKHSWGLLKADAQKLATRNSRADLEYLHYFQDRPLKPMGSHVSFIFPNLVVVSVFGLSYLFTKIEAQGPERSLVNYRLFEARPDQGVEIPKEHQSLRHKALAEFAQVTVMQEDRSIVEQLQTNLRHHQGPGALGNAERRIHHFQETVLAAREQSSTEAGRLAKG